MKILHTINELRQQVGDWQRQGEHTVFVPTMGNLHAGHLHLVDVARQHGTQIIASIFVNPMQFAPGSDYESYPRTLDQDCEQLNTHAVNAVFAPSVAEMYGEQAQNVALLGERMASERRVSETKVSVAGLSTILCGQYRPGHFDGVATVVAKLFNLVQPQVAVFGEKDFQQLMVIRQLVRDLCFPIEIVGVPTVREADGLAMSSRNQYLTVQERERAVRLYQTLQQVKLRVESGDNFAEIESQAMSDLQTAGFRPEYVSIRQSDDLQPGQPDSTRLQVLAAAWLGQARLIDNIMIR